AHFGGAAAGRGGPHCVAAAVGLGGGPVTAATAAALRPADRVDAVAASLWDRISPEFLAEVNWSATDETITFRHDHQLLGERRRIRKTGATEPPGTSPSRRGRKPGPPRDRV